MEQTDEQVSVLRKQNDELKNLVELIPEYVTLIERMKSLIAIKEKELSDAYQMIADMTVLIGRLSAQIDKGKSNGTN